MICVCVRVCVCVCVRVCVCVCVTEMLALCVWVWQFAFASPFQKNASIQLHMCNMHESTSTQLNQRLREPDTISTVPAAPSQLKSRPEVLMLGW
jgi:hypothetical protein